MRLVKAGWNVLLIDLTDGEPTPFGSKQLCASEAARASAVLGIRNRICLGMPNRYLQATLECRREVARVLRERRPSVLFGPNALDAHPDHVEATRLVEISCFEAKLHRTHVPGEPHCVGRTYSYHPLHRLTWDKPLFVVDVTSVWDRKIAASRAYESQLKNGVCGSAPLWVDRVEAVCRYFGELTGCRYAEPFLGSTLLGPHDLPLAAR